MEERQKFPKEVRKPGLESMVGWEDGIISESDIEILYELLEMELQKQGVNLAKSKVLEVGSGSGVFLNYLKGKKVDAVGVDVRPRGKKELPLVIARIEKLPFADESFDVIISNQLFDNAVYDQDQDIMMREIARILKSGGIYIGTGEEIIGALQIEGFNLVSNPSDKNYKVVYKKS